MKLKHAYSNQQLVDALNGRDDVYESLLNDTLMEDLDDEQIRIVKNYTTLTQFERDLLYLKSTMSVSQIASLYAVSRTIIYKSLKKIRAKLS